MGQPPQPDYCGVAGLQPDTILCCVGLTIGMPDDNDAIFGKQSCTGTPGMLRNKGRNAHNNFQRCAAARQTLVVQGLRAGIAANIHMHQTVRRSTCFAASRVCL